MLSRVEIGLDTTLYRRASKEHQANCSSIESMYQQLKGDLISPWVMEFQIGNHIKNLEYCCGVCSILWMERNILKNSQIEKLSFMAFQFVKINPDLNVNQGTFRLVFSLHFEYHTANIFTAKNTDLFQCLMNLYYKRQNYYVLTLHW